MEKLDNIIYHIHQLLFVMCYSENIYNIGYFSCSLLCTRYLKKENIQLADRYLQLFCSKYEEVNGKEACTPNMHLHLHLKECLNDYGPLYSFWCYAFERHNGMLGDILLIRKS